MITRPEPSAAATADAVAARGFVPVLAPLLRLRTRALRPAACDAVMVSSANALPALPASLRALPLLAVGDATAEQARQAGFTRVSSAAGDAASLTALAVRQLPAGAALLLAAGQGQGGGLAAALRGSGFRVHRRVAYAATPAARLPRPAQEALGRGRLRAALFLSAETARAFVRLLPGPLHPALAGIEALAIGQPAADALSLLPWHRVRVSVKPTLHDVLALL